MNVSPNRILASIPCWLVVGLAVSGPTLVAQSAAVAPSATVNALVPSAPNTRLFHIAVERFLRDGAGQGWSERGWLDARGQFQVYATNPIALHPSLPESALGKRLIFTEAWYALGQIGPQARANFRLTPPETPLLFGNLIYFEVEPHPEARRDAGLLSNVSTRGYVEPGRPLTGGFVVSDHPRRVVIRGIGPTLAAFQVAQPLPDPVITVFRGSDAIHENDDWGAQSLSNAIAATFVQVGAFALPAQSGDAALVVELPPGAYTAQVRSTDDRGGEALVEVYVIP